MPASCGDSEGPARRILSAEAYTTFGDDRTVNEFDLPRRPGNLPREL